MDVDNSLSTTSIFSRFAVQLFKNLAKTPKVTPQTEIRREPRELMAKKNENFSFQTLLEITLQKQLFLVSLVITVFRRSSISCPYSH